jgi:hypothetical protein
VVDEIMVEIKLTQIISCAHSHANQVKSGNPKYHAAPSSKKLIAMISKIINHGVS